MTDPIFTLKDLITIGVFLITVGGFWLRLRKITQNDFGGFIKRKEFEELEKTVNRMDNTLARLDERSLEQKKQIDFLFKKVNSR